MVILGRKKRFTIATSIFAVFGLLSTTAALAGSDDYSYRNNKKTMMLPVTTQGPFWPPAAMMDENGDFVMVGISLNQASDGNVEFAPGSAVIVSKETLPPLDSHGREDFSNPFGAPYTILRELDLSPDSDDLDMELFTNSYGPPSGHFGGGPRIPKLGESSYNLNGFSVNGENCPELFPSASQKDNYTRDSFPLVQSPIVGFQGDGVAYNIDTGEEQAVRLKNGADCPPDGCLGEDATHSRREQAITLGEWLRARVHLTIKLKNWDRRKAAYTAAKFTIRAKNLLPNSIYTTVALRQSFLRPSPLLKLPAPATPTSHIITDSNGSGRLSFTIDNPFPATTIDDAGLRVIGLGLAYKSDFALHGGCSVRFGAGVDIHAVAVSTANGNFDFTDFVTVAPEKHNSRR